MEFSPKEASLCGKWRPLQKTATGHHAVECENSRLKDISVTQLLPPNAQGTSQKRGWEDPKSHVE